MSNHAAAPAERALEAARRDIEGCGLPAFVAVALTTTGAHLAPLTFAALRPATRTAEQLQDDHPTSEVCIVACAGASDEHLWTVYDGSGSRRLLTRREVPERPLRTLLDVL